jgi:lysozyme family protein
MAAQNFSAALALILSYEGGLVDNPSDPGGITNWGVTLNSLGAFLGKTCCAADIRNLTRATVAPLYQRDFWSVVNADALPPGVDLITFDAAVNQGPGKAARVLQRCVGVTADGQIGDVTLRAVQSIPAALLIERIRVARLASYQEDGDWPKFGVGWTRRVNGIAQTATAWAAKTPPSAPAMAANDPVAATRAAIGE